MHIRHGRVVAPDEVELGAFGEIGRAARHRTIGAGPGLAAHSAAQSAPIKLARPEPVEEAQRHAVAGEQTVRPGIVQRQDRLRPPAPDNLVDPLVDLVERSLPGDALELPGAFRSDAAQRIQKPLRPVHKGLHVARHLCADDPGRIAQRVRPADLGDTAVIDRDGDAARIGAIEGADAGALFERHPKDSLRSSDPTMILPGQRGGPPDPRHLFRMYQLRPVATYWSCSPNSTTTGNSANSSLPRIGARPVKLAPARISRQRPAAGGAILAPKSAGPPSR